MKTSTATMKKKRRAPATPVALLARLIGLEHEDLPQRGSALLATLMIITGLTLLGLGFVAITSTESAISVNQRNYTQTLQVAEAAALRCVDWFQNPNWALDQQIMPANHDAFKVVRRLTVPVYVGRYKSTVGDILFDKPFRTAEHRHRFYGTENNPDIWITPRTSRTAGAVNYPAAFARPVDFLTLFNIKLFNNNPALNVIDNNEGGVITDIRIYAPQVEGANVNTEDGWTAAQTGLDEDGEGFVEGGTRFGVATIRVTATKYQPPCTSFVTDACDDENVYRVIGTRTVKMTVTEWPFPGPNGPLQTNANLDTSGNIQVHWGRTTAAGDMEMAKTFSGIPWQNAYEWAHFEHGYDPLTFPLQYTSTSPRAESKVLPQDNNNYLYELLGRSFPDPWWEMRARGNISGVAAVTQPTPYDYAANQDPQTNRSNWFQLQNQSNYPDQQNMLFPRIDYNFWKQVARSADDQTNIYYLQWVAGQEFRDKAGNIRDVQDWIDVMQNPPGGTGPKSLPGFYFFDTRNGLNPQNNGPGTLTPDIVLRGGDMEAKGFWYFNAAVFGTKGLNGYNEWVNMPGEPFRDIGFWLVDDNPVSPDYKRYKRQDALGAPCTFPAAANCAYYTDGIGNRAWDFQDLPWSNGAAAKNGIFDFVVESRHAGAARQYTNPSATVPVEDSWGIKPYDPGVAPAAACNPGVTCSEPHEPYLNLIYPTVAAGSTVVDWHAPAALTASLGGSNRQTRRPKRTVNDEGVTPLVCSTAESLVPLGSREQDRKDCTSNAYDKDGGLVQLELSFNGVLYNEGLFDTTGNATYFGSVLAQGDASKAGTPVVYFDERLVKGAWPPGNFGFPRVYISSEQTDQ